MANRQRYLSACLPGEPVTMSREPKGRVRPCADTAGGDRARDQSGPASVPVQECQRFLELLVPGKFPFIPYRERILFNDPDDIDGFFRSFLAEELMGLFDRQRKVDLVRVFFPLLVFDIIPGNGSDRRAEIVFDEAGKQFVGDIYEAPAVEGFRPDDLFEVEYGGLDLPSDPVKGPELREAIFSGGKVGDEVLVKIIVNFDPDNAQVHVKFITGFIFNEVESSIFVDKAVGFPDIGARIEFF